MSQSFNVEIPKRSIFANSARVRGKTIVAVKYKAYELNETAEFIWKLCDGKTSIEDMVRNLSQEFDVEMSELQADVLDLLATWKQAGLID